MSAAPKPNATGPTFEPASEKHADYSTSVDCDTFKEQVLRFGGVIVYGNGTVKIPRKEFYKRFGKPSTMRENVNVRKDFVQ